ncbi:MAG TPA: choice-of-anchor tandem repeat GloVer-containing protein [Tepidisphaeraceae bacterium]|jgi:uncharacterized repeat protein (TIGR03803 family)
MDSHMVSRRHSAKKSFRRSNRSRKCTSRAIVEAAEPRFLLSTTTYTLHTLATFTGSNGSEPDGTLIIDGPGNLYGTASGGGPDVDSNGTVFEVPAGSNSLTTLGVFDSGVGSTPQGNLVADGNGNFFGTVQQGGDNVLDGAVFEVNSASTTPGIVASFDLNDGFFPEAGLVRDSSGDLFGTTAGGGVNNNNSGLVFEVAAGSDIPTTIATFDGDNGASPQATLLMDSAGNLFGTTASGGGTSEDGTVFEVAAGSNTITTLATFTGSNGARPVDNLIEFDGDLYGTTASGGANNSEDGTVFKLDPTTKILTTLVTFNGTDGSGPYGGVIADSNGDLFGTTNAGGDSNGDGVVFEIPAGANTPTSLATFNGSNGRNPFASLLADSNGNLYGTTNQGGASDDGTVFELTPNSNSGGGGGGGTTGTASQLVFTAQPGSATAGGKLSSITVAVEDSSGNTITSNRSKVTLSLVNSSGVKITGSTSANVKNGQAVFGHLSLRTAGTYTLQASDGSLTAADSTPFTINPAAGKKLIFSTEPAATSTANTFSTQLEILDQYGNIATNDTSAVTLALGSHPKDSTLSGILSDSPVDGLADFTGLSVSTAGNYTLKAADGKLKATSKKFAVS